MQWSRADIDLQYIESDVPASSQHHQPPAKLVMTCTINGFLMLQTPSCSSTASEPLLCGIAEYVIQNQLLDIAHNLQKSPAAWLGLNLPDHYIRPINQT